MNKLTRLLYQGIRGDDVKQIQGIINAAGITCTVDGDFGPATRSAVISYQRLKGLEETGIVDQTTYACMQSVIHKVSDYVNVIQYPLKDDEYYNEVCYKSRVVLHHTASGPNPYGVIGVWDADLQTVQRGAVATAYVVGGADKAKPEYDGQVVQCFPENRWAFSLGVSSANYTQIERSTIAIEVCNWGWLTFRGGKYYSYAGVEIPSDEVYIVPGGFRGQQFFQKYTDKQIASLKSLLIGICRVYQIPADDLYNLDWFNANQKYLASNWTGIGNHTQYRLDKTDLYPDDRILTMLQEVQASL